MRALLFLALFLLTPAARADVPVGELPDLATPLAYRIDLSVDPRKERFSGTTEIDIDLAGSTDTLYLHGNGVSVARADAVPAAGRAVRARFEQVHPTGVARLTFARPLGPGRHTLRFAHSAPFMRSAEGLYRAETGGRWYAWTQFQAIDARRVFPGFDEPRHKTPFTLALTVPAGMQAFANTPETARRTARGGLVRHEFATSQPLPTYLVALAVGDFDVVAGEIPPNPVRKEALPFRAIATRGQGPRLAYTVAETPKILARMEAYFGSPYPYEKLDVIASPIMGGAMENVGLVTFNDTLLLIDEDAPVSQLRSFGVVMAHELAHMWFGNLVTPRWWDDIWLNE
ncbi:MAG: M1 family metallopeptidase, partial [Sphingomonadaceae bacterium]